MDAGFDCIDESWDSSIGDCEGVDSQSYLSMSYD